LPSKEEFDKFYFAEHRRLFMFLCKLGASWDDAWEVTQETFTKALHAWDKIEKPLEWIRKVAKNDYVKRQVRSKEDVVRAVRGDWVPRPEFSDFLLSEEAKRVFEAIASLPPRQRHVMAWYYDGYKVGEIAEILSLSPGLVRVHLHHARERLKRLLSLPEDDPGFTLGGGAQ
jgi:RNA polymerase sigma-70 factor (ECF subfamily)